MVGYGIFNNFWGIPEYTNIVAIGISCGGPLDSKRGVVKSPPNLPGWDNIPIVKVLEDFSVKSLDVAQAKGNKFAGYVFMAIGVMLGKGLAILIDVFNPEKVVVESIWSFMTCETTHLKNVMCPIILNMPTS